MKVFLLSMIFILGFFLRAQETLSGNFLFLKDQGRDLLAVRSIVADKKLTLIGPYTGLQAVFQGPLYYYLLAVPFGPSGGNPRAVMWLMLFASMSAIWVGYLTGRRFFSEEVGLAIAFLYAVSPAAAAAATFIWSPFFVLPIASVAIYFLLDYLQMGKVRSFVFVSCVAGLLYHFETAFAVPFTISVIAMMWYVAKRKRYPFPIYIFVGIILMFLSPLIIFDARHNFLTSRSLIQFVGGANQGLGGGETYWKIVYDHFIRFILNLDAVFVSERSFAEFFSFLAIIGTIGYIGWGKSTKIKTLIFLPFLIFVVYLTFPFQIWDWYLIGLFPIYLILGGIFLHWLIKDQRKWLLFAIIVGLLFQSSIIRLQKLYAIPDYGGTSKLKGKIDAIDAIYHDGNNKPFNLMIFTPVVLTDAYDYLLWWHGQKTYRYLPGKEKRDTLYLLIEPDPSKPWSYNGWLETEIKVGKVLETRELPSGFIIQKREI